MSLAVFRISESMIPIFTSNNGIISERMRLALAIVAAADLQADEVL